MFRKLYAWTMRLAGTRQAPAALAAISFAESSFFPIPPDAMLIPMCLARPDRAFWYATICTVTSVLGGMLGYAIGYLLYDTVGQSLIQFYGYGQQAADFRTAYAEWGHWIILIKGLTPIPYKIVTITSGLAAYDLFWFMVLSIITRGARFFLVATLLHFWGPAARDFIERRLEWVAFAALIAFVGGFAAVTYLF
jgi:membrane protein YqaA with SNARE-associated domain